MDFIGDEQPSKKLQRISGKSGCTDVLEAEQDFICEDLGLTEGFQGECGRLVTTTTEKRENPERKVYFSPFTLRTHEPLTTKVINASNHKDKPSD